MSTLRCVTDLVTKWAIEMYAVLKLLIEQQPLTLKGFLLNDQNKTQIGAF